MTHLDTDTMVSVGAALDWDVDGALAHLAACEACRETVARLAEARAILSEEVAPRSGFHEAIMASLTTIPPAAREPYGGVMAGINAIFAAGAVLLVSLGGAGGGGADGTAVGVVALAAAGATYWWNRRRGRVAS